MNLLQVKLGTYLSPDSFSMVPRHCARAIHKGEQVTLLPQGGRNNRTNAIKGATEFALREGYRGIEVTEG
jgi:hypothetical protein